MLTPGLFRLFLAFAVVVHHSFPLRMGGWAVGMFFVLSGYWIARMWTLKYSRQSRRYTTFLISRWWRIAPLFVFVQLLAALLVSLGFPGNGSATENWKWWITQPLVVGSTWFERLLPPSWSLDVEMQFYLVAPFAITALAWLENKKLLDVSDEGTVEQVSDSILAEPMALATGYPLDFIADRRMSPVASAIGSVRFPSTFITGLIVVGLMGWSLWRLGHGATLETSSLDLFAWLFFIGILATRWTWKPSLLAQMFSGGAVVLLVAGIMSSAATRELVWIPGSATNTLPVYPANLFFIVLCLLGIPMAIGTVHRKSDEWDRWMGDLSYPLYLVHWLPRDWYYANVDWMLGPVRNGGLLLLNFVFAFAGAVLLLQLVDRPAQKMRQKWVGK